jgi:FtsH-binding integral membrane protein
MPYDHRVSITLFLSGAGFLLPYNSFIATVDYFHTSFPGTTIVFDISLVYTLTALMGPLLSMAIMMNPSLEPSAMMLTSAIFACFTGAALFAPDGKYLYLGGTLLSGLSTLLFLGFLNIFFKSQLLFQAHLYLGLAILCGFIMFDTQAGITVICSERTSAR